MPGVVIDRTGQWWRGTEASDIGEYLRDFEAGGYPVERVVHAACTACGGSVFEVLIDRPGTC